MIRKKDLIEKRKNERERSILLYSFVEMIEKQTI